MSTPRTFSFGSNADGSKIISTTTAQVSDPTFKEGDRTTFQGYVTGGGSATVVVQGSDDANSYIALTTGGYTNNNWVTLGTITLSAGTPSDGFAVQADWRAVRANVTAVSGGALTVKLASARTA